MLLLLVGSFLSLLKHVRTFGEENTETIFSLTSYPELRRSEFLIEDM